MEKRKEEVVPDRIPPQGPAVDPPKRDDEPLVPKCESCGKLLTLCRCKHNELIK